MPRNRKLLLVPVVLLGVILLPRVARSENKVAVVDTVQAVLKLKLNVRQAVASALDDLSVAMVALEDLTPEDAACSEPACFVEVAKRVGASHLLLVQGVANPAGYRLALDIRDGKTGRSLGTDGKDCELCAEDQFASTVQSRVSKLWARITKEQAAPDVAPPPPSPMVAVPQPKESPGVDTSTIPPLWQQPTPMMGLGFGAAGLLAMGFGAYYVAVDGKTVAASQSNPARGVLVRDTGKWGWSLIGVGALSLAGGAAMFIWGRDDGTSVSVAVGPSSLGLQGKF